MNDEDRDQWIDNDIGLYTWWKISKLSKRNFIRKFRSELDKIIANITKEKSR